MALYHLDPRRSDGAPDVRVARQLQAGDVVGPWRARIIDPAHTLYGTEYGVVADACPGCRDLVRETVRYYGECCDGAPPTLGELYAMAAQLCGRPHSTEAAALAAARHAAGFGHVAEVACASFLNTDGQSEWCSTCAWPRAAHTANARANEEE